MIDLNIKVSGQDQIERNFLGVIPQKMRTELVSAMLSGMIDVASSARALAPYRHGDLRNSIDVKVTETSQSVIGRVYSNDFVARIMENGTNNSTVRVRAYVRHVASADRYAVAIGKRGRPLTRMTHVGVGMVRSYTRASHIAPHPFMRPGFESNRGNLEQRLAQAVDRAVV